jgi:hypothetical protein
MSIDRVFRSHATASACGFHSPSTYRLRSGEKLYTFGMPA